jgi:fructokinase
VRIGIDLGGTKIEGIAFDDSGATLIRRRVATPRDDYSATLHAVADLVATLERELAATATVGIGIPGTISPETGFAKNANSTWLIGRPLADDLQRLLSRSLRFANDANCFALSEAVDGAAAGAAVVFGAIIGTGTGGGIVVDRRVVTGANGIAGEWGHNPMPWARPEEWPGGPCYCGRTGCIETFLSGPGLSLDYASADASVSPEEIVRRAGAGESLAAVCLDRYEDRLARALASVINIVDPDVIVLGGGLSNIERLYDNVPIRWRPYVFTDRINTRLLRAMHGDSSGVRGAAWLWNGPESPRSGTYGVPERIPHTW